MVLSLHQLPKKSQRRGKRRGRGNASGRGNYSGRGQKGQRSRSGGRKNLRRRGLKQFLQQLPKKRGFLHRGTKPEVVSIERIEKRFASGTIVSPRVLFDAGLISTPAVRVKVLGGAPMKKRLTVHAHAFSKTAEHAIKKAGGTAIIIAPR